jgi:hypothetical protein
MDGLSGTPEVDRRTVLRTLLGALGASSLPTVSAANGTSQRSTPAGDDEPFLWTSATWSSYEWTDNTNGHQYARGFTSHSLNYLGATWRDYGNPAGDGGAWQHTFLVSGTMGTAYSTDRDAPPESWRGADRKFFDSQFRIQAGDEFVDQDEVEDGSDSHVVDEVAVAARRDPNLIGFADPAIVRSVVDESEEMRTGIANIDPQNEHVNLVRALERKDRESDEEEIVKLAIGTVLSVIPYAGAALFVTDLMLALLAETKSGESPPYYAGVAEKYPRKRANGGHYAVFDVFVPPGDGVESAQVQSSFVPNGKLGEWRYELLDGTTQPRWNLNLDRLPEPSGDHRQFVRNPDLVRLDEDQTSFTAGPSANIDRTPAWGETAPPGEVEFDAGPSAMGSVPIEDFSWRVVEDDRFERTVDRANNRTEPTWSVTLPEGDFYVELTAEDENGATNTMTEQFTVGAAPSVDVETVAPVVTDRLWTFEADVDDTSPITYYWWDVETDTGHTYHYEGRNRDTIQETFEDLGTVVVTLRVRDDHENEGSTTESFDIVNNDAPQADFRISDASPTVDETVTLDASPAGDPDGAIVDYAWTIGGRNRSWSRSGRTVEVSFPKARTYDVELAVTDDLGGTATNTRRVDVTRTRGNGGGRGSGGGNDTRGGQDAGSNGRRTTWPTGGIRPLGGDGR